MWRAAASPVARALPVLLLCAALATGVGALQARTAGGGSEASIAVKQLPRQGQRTYRLIRQGGPFPYEKDGTIFGNRERLLPVMRRGYYREYTVETFGLRNRGARRIVCGGTVRTQPDACYYTSDHYSSFKRIVEE